MAFILQREAERVCLYLHADRDLALVEYCIMLSFLSVVYCPSSLNTHIIITVIDRRVFE